MGALADIAVGGLLFGIGMTLAGGCANKKLVRVVGGSLRSLVVLTFAAIASYMTLKGLFGQWRARWLDPLRVDLGERGWPDQRLDVVLARLAGLDPTTALVEEVALGGFRVGGRPAHATRRWTLVSRHGLR